MTRRVVLAVLACAAVATSVAAQVRAEVMLVVPFEIARLDPRAAWLGEGAAVGLISALRGRGAAVVGRDEWLAALERLELPPGAPLTRATVTKVAELVGASRVVTGRVVVGSGEVNLEARVLDLDSARMGDVVSSSTPVAGLLESFVRLAAALDGRGSVRDDVAAVAPSVPAFELFVRGLTAPTADGQERYLGQALEMASGYLEARVALWDARTARGTHAQALAGLGPAATARVGTLGVRRAWSLIELGRYDEAFTALSALDATARTAVVANLLGVVQLRRGTTPNTGRAAYYFNQAVERDALDAAYCFNLGYAYWHDRDPLAAAYWLREAVRRDPTDGDAHFVLSAALAASGAKAEAERERELARRLSSRWEESAGDVVPSGLERLKERARQGLAALEAALVAGTQRDHRELAAHHLAAAQRAFDDGRDPDVMRELQRALYLTPYDAGALLLLGRVQARRGLLHEAMDAMKIAIWSAESATAHVELGELLLRTRDAAGALRAAERALEMDPQSAAAADLAARARAARSGAA